MLHHGHQLNVGEAHVVDVVGQLHGQFAIGQRAVALFGDAHPGAEVHFVDRDGCFKFVLCVTLAHPLGIAPLVVQIPYDRRRARRNFVVIAVRVRLVDRVHVVARADVVLVDASVAKLGKESFPHPGALARVHGMRIGIPSVEVAHHRDALCVGRPHREVGAAPAVLLDYV